MKQKLQALLLLFIVAITAVAVSATQPGEAVITNAADRGEGIFTSADTVNVEAGNIQYADLDSEMSTYRWAGLLGNVTGYIVLGDSDQNELYSWTGAGKLVYASEAASITWTSLVDAVEGDMLAYITGGSDSDNYATTFNGVSEDIGSGIFSISSDFASTFNSTGTGTWKTYSLREGTNIVWAGLVDEDGDSYNGDIVDYQMILPEDGTGSTIVAQAYNLWIELV